MLTSDKEKKAQQYWEMSSAWNGRIKSPTYHDVGSLLQGSASLAGKCNCTWRLLEELSAGLLSRVTHMKRNRKSKPIDNVVLLKPVKFQASTESCNLQKAG